MLTFSTDQTPAGLAPLAERYAADPGRWPVPPRFTAGTRWYARIAAHDDHEAWLLTWLPGQRTDLHDHGGASGAFHVVAGRLTEHTPRAAAGTGLIGTPYDTGATRRFGARHIHLIANEGPVPAVSVHVYAPALTTMTRYRLDGSTLRAVRVERAGADW